ncbi:MAG: hypothetical protein DRI83_02855 [Bacteroidetes bacterium]|nr:MAG: hypothetical protein DRI83_02855 [Bacteroidota bacterium]
MKNFFHKDVLFSTLFVFFVMYLLRLFIFNIEFLSPIANTFKDFQFSDIYYSKLKEKHPSKLDTNIVLVNIAYNSREEIARQIHVINQHKPAVIGLDVTFEKLKDSLTDSILAAEIADAGNVVLAGYFINSDEGSEYFANYITSDNQFRKNTLGGYINFPSFETEATIRYFTPKLSYKEEIHYCFAAMIAGAYDKASFEKLMKRRYASERIDYTGNIESFIVFDAEEINISNPGLSVVEGKIVLLGFMGPDLKTKVLEDLHFTPMNPKYSGRSFPDMYGLVIHANILTTILAGNYTLKMPFWISIVLAFILTYFCMYFFIKYYVKWVIWYQIIVRSLQLIISIIIVGIDIFLFSAFNFKMDAMILVIPILLSIDTLEIYEGIALWLNKRFRYKTLFVENN